MFLWKLSPLSFSYFISGPKLFFWTPINVWRNDGLNQSQSKYLCVSHLCSSVTPSCFENFQFVSLEENYFKEGIIFMSIQTDHVFVQNHIDLLLWLIYFSLQIMEDSKIVYEKKNILVSNRKYSTLHESKLAFEKL